MDKIKRIPVNIVIKKFLITFEYETIKGHRREQQRTIRQLSKDAAKEEFNKWSKSIRTMVNVKILSIVELYSSVETIVI